MLALQPFVGLELLRFGGFSFDLTLCLRKVAMIRLHSAPNFRQRVPMVEQSYRCFDKHSIAGEATMPREDDRLTYAARRAYDLARTGSY